MKKFWEKVSIKKISSDSFCIMLDDRILKTPLKRDLVLPNLNLAQEIVKEWDQDAKKLELDESDEILKSCIVTKDGNYISEILRS